MMSAKEGEDRTMVLPSTYHTAFVLERTYEASPERVFAAWSNADVKSRWFRGPAGWTETCREFDFRVGGRERMDGVWDRKTTTSFNAIYYDIIPNERLVYAYDMYLDDERISVSLVTIDFDSVGTRTRLVLTEQALFLDGYPTPGDREGGNRGHLERLEDELKNEPYQQPLGT